MDVTHLRAVWFLYVQYLHFFGLIIDCHVLIGFSKQELIIIIQYLQTFFIV